MGTLYKQTLVVLCFLFIAGKGSGQTAVVDTVCGGSLVNYRVEPTAGSVYHWTVNGGIILTGNGTHAIGVKWNKAPGLYNLNVVEKNASGCMGDPVNSYVFIKGREITASGPKEGCLNDTITLAATGGIWYNWNNGVTDSMIRFKLTQDTAFMLVVQDTTCGNTDDTIRFEVKAKAKPQAGFYSNTGNIIVNQRVDFTYSGGSDDKVYWSIQKSSIPNSRGHSVTTMFNDTGMASVSLVSVNKFGCRDTFHSTFEITDEQLFFPTAFTPNGDGINDTYKIGGTNIRSFSMDVYNRWGQIVYRFHEVGAEWNGDMDGEPLPDGVYEYRYDAVGNSGKRFSDAGSITIVR